jgi:ureidoacrylate peracid hydrolase
MSLQEETDMNFAAVPERMALINVDMQNCFVAASSTSAPNGLAVLDRINQLAAVCRTAGILVIHARHVLRPDGSNMGVLREVVAVKEGMINQGAASAALHEGLVVDVRDILLDKPRFGAFHGTDLDLILRTRGIDSVMITGIATNVCCETTAREAMVRDYQVFFLSDGTTTFGMGNATGEELQKATLATLGFLFAQVLTVAEMIQKIKDSTVLANPDRETR